MKPIKILSLTAVAAVVAMAFVGASTAFASSKTVVLCKKAELECKEPWPNPTTFVGHGQYPKLLTSIGTFECEKSSIEVTLLNELSALGVGHVLSFILEGNCHLGSIQCTVLVNELGGASGVHGPNPLEAIITPVPLTLGGGSSMETKGSLKCGFLINCTFTFGEEMELTAVSNKVGEVTIVADEAFMKRSTGFCPETSKMDASYTAVDPKTLKPLTGLYIES
jgi:hypothetical protein